MSGQRSENPLDAEQLRVLRHMLGIDRPDVRDPKPYRDYYCANPGDPTMHELVRLGAVRRYDTRGGYEWFTCTDAGRAAGIASHKTIRYSRSALRYSRYLDMKDCYPDLTFHRFLTDSRFRDAT
ncbi:MAG TPA: hypothetical protein VFX20_17990 [Steroidobacteraceae bacterium]|nr:hypothetical protein [Steroidobacteraceae bacterium]